ncbi:MAG: hypothetical protein ACE5K4_11020 [Candidatus Hydrothermarchaeota archaeon]
MIVCHLRALFLEENFLYNIFGQKTGIFTIAGIKTKGLDGKISRRL